MSYRENSTHPIQEPIYTNVLDLEKAYSNAYWINWFKNYWQWSLYISTGYLTAIFLGSILMRNRPRFELKVPLLIWNFSLAVFSLLGAVRTWPELSYILQINGENWQESGWFMSVCRREHHNQATAFWGLLFTLSKALELGDTFFIVARKQPLIFLHWYHHITVLSYTWYTYSSYDSTSRWFMVMNYIVHSLMYSYYGLKTLKIKLPKAIPMLITTLQLSQMVIGVIVNTYSFNMKVNHPDVHCTVRLEHIELALVMYGSYFLLFGKFFVEAYFAGAADRRRRASSIKSGTLVGSGTQGLGPEASKVTGGAPVANGKKVN